MGASPRFSANLGFLWAELSLPDAIRRAKAAGFAAVECHWPYGADPSEVREALDETGLQMLGLNTRTGREGEFGLSALPGRESEARAAIEEAFDYAEAVAAKAVHVMAGVVASKARDAAEETFFANLGFACELAGESGRMVLIEPLNRRDAPGYFLDGLEQASEIVERLGRPELRIMFDCYHLQIMGGDLARRFAEHRARIGHVQFAAVPSRAEPDEGEIAYDRLLPLLTEAGWDGYFGAEYRPRASTDAGLSWMNAFPTTVVTRDGSAFQTDRM